MTYQGGNLLLREQRRAELERIRQRQRFKDIQQGLSAVEDIKNRQFERQRQQAEVHGKLAEQLAQKRDPYAKAPYEEAAQIGQMGAQVKRQQDIAAQQAAKAKMDWDYKTKMDVAKTRAGPQWAKVGLERDKPKKPMHPAFKNIINALEKGTTSAGTAMNEFERAKSAKMMLDVASYADAVASGYPLINAYRELRQMHPELIKFYLPEEPGGEVARTETPTSGVSDLERQPNSLDEYEQRARAELEKIPAGSPERRILEGVIQDIFAFKGFVRNKSVTEQKAIDIITAKAASRVRTIANRPPGRARDWEQRTGKEGYLSYTPGEGIGVEEPPMQDMDFEREPLKPKERQSFEKAAKENL